MPRNLTTIQARAILAQDTAEVFLPCLKIVAGETFRIVNNTQAITKADGEYEPYPFEPSFPNDSDEASGSVSVRISNIDRQVTEMLKSFNGIPLATLELVTANDPDSPILGPCEFSVTGAEANITDITLNLGHEEDFLNQQVPAQSYIPSTSQGLFQ